MSTKVGDIIGAIRNLLGEEERGEERRLSLEEQTRLSWAQRITSAAEIPEPFRPFFESIPAEQKDPFPYTVLSPSYRGFLQPEREKLITQIDSVIYIVAGRERRPAVIGFPLADIVFMEAGTMLLSAWLTVAGTDPSGAVVSSTLRFNSVTEHLLAPFLEGFRNASAGARAGSAGESEYDGFASFGESYLRFENYARKSILPGAKILQTILQPEVRRPFLFLPGAIMSSQITPTHLTILTDRELILIREDSSRRWSREHQYGCARRFIPRNKIVSLTLTAQGEEILVLSILLTGGASMELLFHVSLEDSIQQLQQRIKTGSVG